MNNGAATDTFEAIAARAGEVLELPQTGAWPATRHLLDVDSVHAIIAAAAAGRPLLVRGEPGIGKSQLARAAAVLLDRPFMATVIQPDSEYQELLWAMDHTKRLADAQLASTTGSTEKVEDSGNYIGPGALWWAMNWATAEQQANRCNHNYTPADDIDSERVKNVGCVLLVDEIDKADISLTNGLLEVLGNRQFQVPTLGRPVRSDAHPAPLVVLTSNDARQLPPALLRRCVVHSMQLPEDLHAHFLSRGETHHPKMAPDVLDAAATQILEDRRAAAETAKTGLAEYLDLLRTLDTVSTNTAEQLAWLEKLGRYFLKSQAG